MSVKWQPDQRRAVGGAAHMWPVASDPTRAFTGRRPSFVRRSLLSALGQIHPRCNRRRSSSGLRAPSGPAQDLRPEWSMPSAETECCAFADMCARRIPRSGFRLFRRPCDRPAYRVVPAREDEVLTFGSGRPIYPHMADRDCTAGCLRFHGPDLPARCHRLLYYREVALHLPPPKRQNLPDPV